MKFGGRVVTDVTVLTARCDAELRSGHRTSQTEFGTGAMTMGVAWAWPHPMLLDSVKLNVVLRLAEEVAKELNRLRPQGHPLEICEVMAHVRKACAHNVANEFGLNEPIPDLAALLATSPLEAALFDAQGKAVGRSSYDLLGPDHVTHDLAQYLGPNYAKHYLSQYVSVVPVASLPVYHLVGALDPLGCDDVLQPVGDGLPETLQEWIKRDALSHLKIKLAGDDFDWDLDRVLKIHATAISTRPGGEWSYSLDFNERCESAEYVLELIQAIELNSRAAVNNIRYVEQPTHRDLTRFPANRMHDVAKRIPVVIDESLTDLNSLRMAVELGYSGVALKACKGHSEALLMAAVAQRDGLYLCVQDLTCVGASLLHSVSLAAHIPGIQAIESNGRQYCPAGNEGWQDRFPDMFQVKQGTMPTGELSGPGLGY